MNLSSIVAGQPVPGAGSLTVRNPYHGAAYGLSSGVVTTSLPHALKAVRALRCGTVNINEVPAS